MIFIGSLPESSTQGLLIGQLLIGGLGVNNVFRRRPRPGGWRRVNMVGVSMALAQFVKFKHGLYKSCDIECFEGMMLEPCLLQPCFHVNGICKPCFSQTPPACWLARTAAAARSQSRIACGTSETEMPKYLTTENDAQVEIPESAPSFLLSPPPGSPPAAPGPAAPRRPPSVNSSHNSYSVNSINNSYSVNSSHNCCYISSSNNGYYITSSNNSS